LGEKKNIEAEIKKIGARRKNSRGQRKRGWGSRQREGPGYEWPKRGEGLVLVLGKKLF